MDELNDRARAAYFELEQFAYFLACAHDAVAALESEAHLVINAERLTEPGSPRVHQFSLSPPETYRLSWAVDRVLSSVRRAQDSLVPYVRRTFACSLPSSFAKTVAALPTATKVPEELRGLLTSYWEQSGARIRDYRDFGQHHAVVSSDARVVSLPDGRRALFLVLPSNPAEKSLRKLRYDEPYVPALSFCRAALVDFYRLGVMTFYVLLRYLGYPESFTLVWFPKDPVSARIGGLSVPSSAPLDAVLHQEAARLQQELQQAYGDVTLAPITSPARRHGRQSQQHDPPPN